PAAAPSAGNGCRRGIRSRCWRPSWSSGLLRACGREEAVDIVLREGGAGFGADLDRLVALAAADAAREALDLETAVRPEIALGVDELARREGDPGQPVVQRGRR